MKKTNILVRASFFLIAAGLVLGGCKKKEDEETMTPGEVIVEPNKTTYQLKTKDALGVSGTVTFTEKSSTETVVDIALTGITSGTHPAHIHAKSAVETGAIVIDLKNVDSTGKSSTIITKQNDGTLINYSQLTNFDGYVNVHESPTSLGKIFAQGDIGGNVLTGDNKKYDLAVVGGLGVSGNILFEKRKNGTTLSTISLTGTISGDSHPANIYVGSVSNVGPDVVAIDLSSVDGTTGKSYTTIRTLIDKTTSISYDQLLKYGGYVKVRKSLLDPTVVTQGNIGSNVN